MEGHRQWRLYNTLYNHQRPSNPPTPMSATPPLPHMGEVVRSGLLSSRPVSSMWPHWRKSERCTMLHGGLSWEGQQPNVPTVTQCQTIFMSVSNSYSSSKSNSSLDMDLDLDTGYILEQTQCQTIFMSVAPPLLSKYSSSLSNWIDVAKIQLTKKDKYGLQNLRNPCHRNLRIRLPKAQVLDSTTYVCSLSWLL